MDDREHRDDREARDWQRAEVRIAALLIAAIARIGTGTPPDQLESEAAQYIPWITRPAAMMLLSITTEGDPMPLTVDSANAVAVLSFTDDHNDAVAPPAGAVATATSSDTTILTVGAAVAGTDANGVGTLEFPLSEVAAGTASLSVTTADASGNPLLGPDGVTPIAVPAPVDVVVNPGAAAAEVFTVPGN
jgi:hypothetical protein